MRPLLTMLAAGAALLAGCGSDESEAPEPAPAPPRAETAHELPDLPRGWEPHVNRTAGVAIGRPPGWKAKDSAGAILLTAPDELVVLSVSADRTDEAFELPPGRFAVATLEALDGYRRPLRPSPARAFGHRYDAAQARAEGTRERGGVRQRVRVFVLRRGRLAVVTGVLAANLERRAPAEQAQALRAVRTIRTRPVG